MAKITDLDITQKKPSSRFLDLISAHPDKPKPFKKVNLNENQNTEQGTERVLNARSSDRARAEPTQKGAGWSMIREGATREGRC